MQTNLRSPLKSLLILLAFVLGSCPFSFAQSSQELIDELLLKYHEYDQFNGSVLVAQEGKVIYKNGIGLANMEWEIPNQSDTKHRLGSISKQFTAVLIVQLAAEGKLDLQAPISQFLPDYPKATADKITIHQLLVHSSGIPNYTALPGFFKDKSRDPYSASDFVKTFQNLELDFQPGDRYSYSNSGYFLLGVIIEQLTGKSYEEVLQERIFKPLGMKNSGYDHHSTILPKRATGYQKDGRSYVNSDYLDMSIPYAAGSLYSTVEDLYLWDQALYTNKLLPEEFRQMLFEPYVVASGNASYAYGWFVGKAPIGNSTDSLDIIAHSGGINGFSTYMTRSESDQSLVVLLNNTGDAQLRELSTAITGILNEQSYEMPKQSMALELHAQIEDNGIEAATKWYETNKGSNDLSLDEGEMNTIGYRLMANGMTEQAAAVFKMNINAFPNSFNTYDSYGEALMNLGDKEAAIANYKTSLDLNAANQNGINMLEQMGYDISEFIQVVELTDETLQSYVGDYELAANFIISISRDGNQLQAQAPGQPMIDIFPRSEDEFYVKAFAGQIKFSRSNNGEIESLTLFQEGQEMTGKKRSR